MNVPYPSHSLSLLSLELFFSSFEKSVGRRMRIERSGVVGNLDCRFIIYKQTTSRGNKKEWPILPGNS